ncbi:MAG TPA: hypothetical protein VGH28_13930 [Polyangiaceae bacterium]|jgi:hypothetical protein
MSSAAFAISDAALRRRAATALRKLARLVESGGLLGATTVETNREGVFDIETWHVAVGEYDVKTTIRRPRW